MKWFKHDTDANMDAKLQEVMLDYGLEGYGLYWYCIELIAQRVSGDNLTFELEHDCRIIARNTGSTPQKVEQMMKSFIGLGLLDADNGHVFCLKLASRCDDFTAKAVRRKGVKPVSNQSVGVSPSLSDKVPLEEEEEVRRRSKKNISNSLVQAEPKPNKFKFSDIDYKCSEWIYRLVIKVAPASKKPNFENWANTIRLMRESDNLTHEDIKEVFTWANQDSFWSVNILSVAKLRKQFAQLQAKMKGVNNGHQGTGSKESDHERIKRENQLKYGQSNECGLAVGENERDLGFTVDEGERFESITRLDSWPFVDY